MESGGKAADIGVVVGRFQVDVLHDGHIGLLKSIGEKHQKVIVFLGLSPVPCTRRNPLDFTARRHMIATVFPQYTVLAIQDTQSDEWWSRELDARIREVFPTGSVMLYGSRDSFIAHYKGAFSTTELPEVAISSGTEIRERIRNDVRQSADFRAGVIYGAYSQFPHVYPTVDVAIYRETAGRTFEVLLAKKPKEAAYRFVGGFVDPTDPTLEAAARREVMEETGLDICDPEYVGSFIVDDWRYRSEVDKIMTTLFVAKYRSGAWRPGDDISELRWVQAIWSERNLAFGGVKVEDCHRPLLVKVTDKLFIKEAVLEEKSLTVHRQL